MRAAAEQAALVTQVTKERMAEFEPVLARAQENYTRSLAQMDKKLEETENEINRNATKVQETVAKPAVSVMAFTAGVAKVLESIKGDE
jgi:hypothetical protein